MRAFSPLPISRGYNMSIDTFKERLNNLISENEDLTNKWRSIYSEQSDVIEEECNQAIIRFLMGDNFLVATGQKDEIVPEAWRGRCFIRILWNEKDNMFIMDSDQRGTIVGDLLGVMMGEQLFGNMQPQKSTKPKIKKTKGDKEEEDEVDITSLDGSSLDYEFPKGLK